MAAVLTRWLLSLGVTRDSAIWLWGRVVAIAAFVVAVSPYGYFDGIMSEQTQKIVVSMSGLVIAVSGKYDHSPLPGKRSVEKERIE